MTAMTDLKASADTVPLADSEESRTRAGRLAIHLAILAAVLSLWELTGAFGLVDPLILPRPSAIMAAFWNIAVVQRLVWWHFMITLYEALAGFLIGSAVGIALAIAAALWPTFRRYISPYVVGLQVTPRIALAPIVIAWLGFGLSPKIGIAALICFFPPFINTLTGLLEVDDEALEMFHSLQAKKHQIFWQLMLPSAMPIIMAGLKTAISLALIGAIVGEFISASEGMGILMQRFTFSLNMAASFAALLMLTLMGLLLFSAMELLDNRLIYWRHDARIAAVSRKKAARWQRALATAS
jgi:NitT/TauT family transport system permease protein